MQWCDEQCVTRSQPVVKKSDVMNKKYMKNVSLCRLIHVQTTHRTDSTILSNGMICP